MCFHFHATSLPTSCQKPCPYAVLTPDDRIGDYRALGDRSMGKSRATPNIAREARRTQTFAHAFKGGPLSRLGRSIYKPTEVRRLPDGTDDQKPHNLGFLLPPAD